MKSFLLCEIPTSLLSLCALASNIAMLAAIYKKASIKQSIHFIFAYIGLINTLRAVLIFTVSFNRMGFDMTDSGYVVLDGSLILFSFLNLQSKVFLAHNRYLAVSCPLYYRTSATLKDLRRRVLYGAAGCIISGSIVAYLNSAHHYRKTSDMIIGGTATVIYVLIGIIYYKVVNKFKESNLNITIGNISSSVLSIVQEYRRKQEKRLFAVCFGVTMSCIALNVPLALTILLYSTRLIFESCSTEMGIAASISISLHVVNIVLDPFWYFWMEKGRVRDNH